MPCTTRITKTLNHRLSSFSFIAEAVVFSPHRSHIRRLVSQDFTGLNNYRAPHPSPTATICDISVLRCLPASVGTPSYHHCRSKVTKRASSATTFRRETGAIERPFMNIRDVSYSKRTKDTNTTGTKQKTRQKSVPHEQRWKHTPNDPALTTAVMTQVPDSADKDTARTEECATHREAPSGFASCGKPSTRGDSSLRESHESPKKLASISDATVEARRYSEPDREPWQVQKFALSKKFGGSGWLPRKRLSPDSLEGIRALHAQNSDTYTTPVLAERFQVSPEAIRRILKSKWRPNDEEEDKRRERWNKRGVNIWTQMNELGIKPPKKWRDQGAGRCGPRRDSLSRSGRFPKDLPGHTSFISSGMAHKVPLAERIY